MDKTKMRQVRMIEEKFTTREDGEDLIIEGYFAVFNSNYDIAPGMSESIAPGAFRNCLGNDIRALINHDTTLVIGRNAVHTLELREDEHGLWGRITVNPKDSDALNAYERVKRGDVSGCSFGFEIVSQETDFRDDGSIHWTLTEVNLFEVSVCTFPAYEETNIAARSAELAAIKARSFEAWREKMKGRLNNGN